jgi:hypothetical protein
MTFRIFEGEWPSLPGRTIVSASESLFPADASRELFGGSISMGTAMAAAGGDDPGSFIVSIVGFFSTAAS